MDFLQLLIFVLPSIMVSFVIHEISHGYAAYIFGDPTAKYQGRLSFNPLIHIDPIGGAMLLITCLSGSSFIFGWAKPVSVNPYNFRHPRQDMAWVAFAGPLSNFAMAAITGLLLKLHIVTPTSSAFLFSILIIFVKVNLGLGLFNLIPFPPLDGSKVLYGLLPEGFANKLMYMEQRYSQIIFAALIIFAISPIPTALIMIPYGTLFFLFTGLGLR